MSWRMNRTGDCISWKSRQCFLWMKMVRCLYECICSNVFYALLSGNSRKMKNPFFLAGESGECIYPSYEVPVLKSYWKKLNGRLTEETILHELKNCCKSRRFSAATGTSGHTGAVQLETKNELPKAHSPRKILCSAPPHTSKSVTGAGVNIKYFSFASCMIRDPETRIKSVYLSTLG